METEHLILRNWQEKDASALYEMCLSEDMQKNGIPYYDSVADSLHTIKQWMRNPYSKVIARKEDGCFAGFLDFGDMNRYEGYMELEYAIAPEYRNRGYATEAIKCMLDYAFKEQNILVIAAWVRSHNPASAHVLEKCSFTLEGRLRRHARDKSDTLCYSILREDWIGV